MVSNLDAFREVQNEATAKLSEHLVQLRASLTEANALHREQLDILRQIVQADRQKVSLGGVPATPYVETASRKNRKVIHLDDVVTYKEQVVDDIPLPPTTMPAEEEKPKEGSGEPTRVRSELELSKANDGAFAMDTPLRVTKGHCLTWGTHIHGHRKILDYDFDRVVGYAAFPLAFHWASIFVLRRSLLVQLICQPIIIMTSAVITYHARMDHRISGDTDFGDTSYGKAVIFINSALQRMVPIVLGLFVSLQLRRWWTIRSHYLQKVHLSSMHISMMLGLVIPASLETFRLRIERYLLAAHKMIFICARLHSHHATQSNYESLVHGGVMTETELKHVMDSIKHAPEILQMPVGAYDMAVAGIPVTWSAQLIFRMFCVCKQNGTNEFPINLCVQMVQQCVNIKKSIQDIEMMLTSPLPWPYVHLVTLVVHACVISSTLEAGVYIGSVDKDISDYSAHMLGSMLLSALYLGLLTIAALLMNPFTEECMNLPANNLHCRMHKAQIFSRHTYYDHSSLDEEISKDLVRKGGADLQRGGLDKTTRRLGRENEDEQQDDIDDDDDEDRSDMPFD